MKSSNPAEWFPGIDLEVKIGKKAAERDGVQMAGEAVTFWDVNSNSAVVYIRKRALKKGFWELACLLSHESCHVAEAWAQSIGEENPASEEMAYMVQCAMHAIVEQLCVKKAKLSSAY